MSTREIERELVDALQRHAEDAMTGTDTHTEHERFREQLEMGADKTPRNRWAAGVAVAAAAAVVAGIGLWGLGGQGGDRDTPPTGPSDDLSEAEIAQGFVEAFGEGDVVRAATYLAPGHEPYPDWEMYVERNVAWGMTFLVEPCEAKTETPFGTAVLCPFDVHTAYSGAMGAGPFTGNSFTVYVKDGAVVQADYQMPFATNGMSDYVDEVWGWVARNYPQDWDFLSLEEEDVPKAQWARWLRMWGDALDAYLEAETGEDAE
jgi:hypothetical protein